MTNNFYSEPVLDDSFIDMNDKQIENAISLFKQTLRDRHKLFTYSGLPLEESCCYTSSSYIKGVYFPNSVVSFLPYKDREARCISMSKDGEYCLVLALKENLDPYNESQLARIKQVCKPYRYIPLRKILYSYEEERIREEFQRYASDCERDLEAWKHLKRVYKKDGTPFARLDANFGESKISITSYSSCYSLNSIEVRIKDGGRYYGSYSLHPSPEELRTLNSATPDDIERWAKKEAERTSENLTQAKKNLKNLHKAMLKVEELADETAQKLHNIFGADRGSLYGAARNFLKEQITYC